MSRITDLFINKKSFAANSSHEFSTDYSGVTLRDIIEKTEYREVYKELIKFSIKEQGLENLFFLEMCKNFKQKPTLELLELICGKFINFSKQYSGIAANVAVDMPYVNISNSCVDKLSISLEKEGRNYTLSEMLRKRNAPTSRRGAISSRGETFAIRHVVEVDFYKVHHGILDDAEIEAFKLAERDTFERFVKEKKS